MEIKNDWGTEGVAVDDGHYVWDRLGFRTKETSVSDWVNGNVPWFRKMLQTNKDPHVWDKVPGSMGDGWILRPLT